MEKTAPKKGKCVICSGTAVLPGYRLYDDRYGFPGEFRLLACRSCGHRFLAGDTLPQDLSDLYTKYYPRSTFTEEQDRPLANAEGLSSWWNGIKSGAYAWVPRNVRVLDIGCGFGESIAYHTARGCEVHGVEVDENVRRIAEKYGYKIHVGFFDAEVYPREYFDYVTMDQVIEHLPDPLRSMRDVAKVLRPGSVAVIGTPNANGWGARIFGKRWINWHVPYHIQYFSVRSMKMAAEQAGLTIERWITVTHSDWLHFQWMHLLTYPKIGTPSEFWSVLPGNDRSGHLLSIAAEGLRFAMVNHAMTRIGDALGAGDNYIFILRKR